MLRFLSLMAAFSAAVCFAEEWTRFRGPNGSGISNATGYPVEFGNGKNMLWRTAVRAGKSSPVLTEKHVFLTAAEGGKLFTQCFDRATGKLAWEREIEQPHKEVANKLNHEAAITPVTDGDNVYVFFKDFGMAGFSSSGKPLWKSPLGPFANLMGLGSSPILAGNKIVLLADQWEGSFISAFDPKSGEMKWKVERTEAEGWGTPAVYEGRVLTAARGQFGIHDAASGKRLATQGPIATSVVGSPVVVDDVAYVFGYGGDAPPPFSARLDRMDKNKDGILTPDEYGEDPIMHRLGRSAGNRDGIVTADEWDVFAKKTLGLNALVALKLGRNGAEILWKQEKNFSYVVPSLLAYQGVLYVMRNGGILTTHDAKTGEIVKAGRLNGALGGYSSSPVAADGRVFIASEEGKMSVVKAGGQWQVEKVNDLGEGIFATPALSRGVIYLRTEAALYAFGSPAGRASR